MGILKVKQFKKKLSLKILTAFFVIGAYVGAGLIGSILFACLLNQRHKAFIINVLGRQRMLLQSMTKDIFAHSEGMGSLKYLQESMNVFENNLMGFLEGGEISIKERKRKVEGIKDERVRRELKEICDSWIYLKGLIISYRKEDGKKMLPEIYGACRAAVEQTDKVASILEDSVERRLKRCLRITSILAVIYILGGVIVWFLLKNNVENPILELINGIKAVTNGDLNKRVEPNGAREMIEALENFNSMASRLKDTIQHLDTIVNGMGEGLYITDLDRKITFVNPMVEKITGFKPEELLGRRCEDVFGHTDYMESRLCNGSCGIKRCYEEKGMVTSGYIFTNTAWGDKIPIYINFTPLRANKGEIKGVIATFMDVSKEKKLEDEITQYKIEIDMAKKIYERLLPQRLPSFKGLRILPKLKPSRELSGDFYDIIPVSDNQVGIFIADVMGHGLPAAFMVSNLKAVLYAERSSMARPSEFMKRVSQMLYTILGEDQFVTALLSVIDTERMILKYASAGHPNPIIFRGQGSETQN